MLSFSEEIGLDLVLLEPKPSQSDSYSFANIE